MKISPTSAFALVLANVLIVIFAPVYDGSSNGAPYRANLMQVGRLSTLTFNIVTPLVLALLAVVPWKPALRTLAIWLFWVYCILGAWTVGMLYLPSAAIITWMTTVRRNSLTA